MTENDLKPWDAKPLVAFAIGAYMLTCCASYVLAAPPHRPPMHRPPAPHVSHHHHSDAVLWGILGGASAIILADSIARQNQPKTIILCEEPKNRVFYWCESERGFFPEVRSCPEGWRKMRVE